MYRDAVDNLDALHRLRRPAALRERIHERLRAAILNGDLAPGTPVIEAEVAARLGASRTPVREALRRLEAEGLLEPRGIRGTVVRGIDRADVVWIYEIREALETLAARRALQRMTEDDLAVLARLVAQMHRDVDAIDKLEDLYTRFHDAIVDMARGERLARMLGDIREEILLWRALSLSTPERRRAGVLEHERMLEAFRARDEATIVRITGDHVRNALQSVLRRADENGTFNPEKPAI